MKYLSYSDINFDQGGIASFILLSGLVVNAGLYIINDFNNLRKKYPGRSSFDLYLKAYNQKIIPVLLTIVSSMLGLIPFIWQGQNEVFWFVFASGAHVYYFSSHLSQFLLFEKLQSKALTGSCQRWVNIKIMINVTH